MRHQNFINSRSYSNEATLFINPTKNKKHKSSKPKIVISFIIVLLIFSSFLSFSALAGANASKWEVWSDDEYLFMDSLGSISKADLMALSIRRDNCEKLIVNFYITSFGREIASNGKKFNAEITETTHNSEDVREYKNEIYVNYSQQINDNVVYVLSFDHEFDTKLWVDRLSEPEPFYFYLSISEHSDKQTDPSLYFEHTDNLWDMEELQNILVNTYRSCRLKTDEMTEI